MKILILAFLFLMETIHLYSFPFYNSTNSIEPTLEVIYSVVW